jgi:hypothetical protein
VDQFRQSQSIETKLSLSIARERHIGFQVVDQRIIRRDAQVRQEGKDVVKGLSINGTPPIKDGLGAVSAGKLPWSDPTGQGAAARLKRDGTQDQSS